jgi:hypothetical protein
LIQRKNFSRIIKKRAPTIPSCALQRPVLISSLLMTGGFAMRHAKYFTLLALLVVFGAAHAATEFASMGIRLEQNAYFSTPQGKPVLVPAGNYTPLPMRDKIVLIGHDDGAQRFREVKAVMSNHDERISVPRALSIRGEKQHNILVLIPGGIALNAVGSYDLVNRSVSYLSRQQIAVYGKIERVAIPSLRWKPWPWVALFQVLADSEECKEGEKPTWGLSQQGIVPAQAAAGYPLRLTASLDCPQPYPTPFVALSVDPSNATIFPQTQTSGTIPANELSVEFEVATVQTAVNNSGYYTITGGASANHVANPVVYLEAYIWGTQ